MRVFVTDDDKPWFPGVQARFFRILSMAALVHQNSLPAATPIKDAARRVPFHPVLQSRLQFTRRKRGMANTGNGFEVLSRESCRVGAFVHSQARPSPESCVCHFHFFELY